jgi:thymidine kinase
MFITSTSNSSTVDILALNENAFQSEEAINAVTESQSNNGVSVLIQGREDISVNLVESIEGDISGFFFFFLIFFDIFY